jgi:hypothetical protein
MSDEMKRDIEKLKSEAADLRGTDKRIAIGLIRLEAKMDHVASLIVDRVDRKLDAMTGRLDDFTGEVLASRRERALQDKTFWDLKDRLDLHQARLDNLEGGRKS